jgi:hypothetical protein
VSLTAVRPGCRTGTRHLVKGSAFVLGSLGASAGSIRVPVPGGAGFDVSLFKLTFRPWRGQPVADAYGNKPVVEYDGQPLFAELAIVRLVEQEGWTGVWVDTYRQRFLRDLPGAGDEVPPPEPARELYGRIASRAGGAGGCWDVLAWRGTEIAFLESKRHGKDRLRPGQGVWLRAALDEGILASSFAVVEWDFTP